MSENQAICKNCREVQHNDIDGICRVCGFAELEAIDQPDFRKLCEELVTELEEREWQFFGSGGGDSW